MVHDFASYHNTGDTLAAVKQRWDDILLRLHGGRVVRTSDGREVPAYVSDSRWVFDCPHCGGADLPFRSSGCCLQCGHVYRVVYPADADAAVEILNDRPARARHWHPQNGETVAALAAENERMRNIEPRLALPAEPTRAVLLVDATFDGGTSPLFAALDAVAPTGWTIRWDDKTGTCELEVLGRGDREMRGIARAVGAKERR